MANYWKKFIVNPGEKVKLKDIDPKYHGDHDSKEDAEEETKENVEKMTKSQMRLYGERKHSLLIVLQGPDAAGKDGTVAHLMSSMNPAGCVVADFKQPTGEELAHDFLWRIHAKAPAKGQVMVFNRSHYEDVLIVKVHKEITDKECEKRYKYINQFENLLCEESNTTVLKFYLHISKEEQLNRFKERLDDPDRQWKISDADYKEREFWDDYQKAFQDMLNATSTGNAPWFVIPSDNKWFRNLAISQIIAKAFDDMNLKLPEPTVDIAKIRKQYHSAVREEKTEKKKSKKK